ncbi:MAG: nuclear transport factor 2 family protein [Cohaesibacter sp.]|nr:nuclear transport factor 2 family protein [Cohaesibacter sp.]
MIVSNQKISEATVQAYVSFYQNISIENLTDVSRILSEDIHFVDPFNNIRGRENVILVLKKMFSDVERPNFVILDVMWSKDICFMRWDFSCVQSMFGEWSFRGMSELHFDEDGLICAHFDYWDSGAHFYAKLPYLGRIIRAIIHKASIN